MVDNIYDLLHVRFSRVVEKIKHEIITIKRNEKNTYGSRRYVLFCNVGSRVRRVSELSAAFSGFFRVRDDNTAAARRLIIFTARALFARSMGVTNDEIQ